MLLNDRYRVYFPFVDGLLAYNCPRCGYRCCKGAGFAATPAEFVTLRQHYPALAYFTAVAEKTTEPLVQLTNFSPKCFFLADDGLCDVQVRHGRDAKPFVCKSFPINAFRLEGDVLVADINFLCPIDVWSGADGDSRIHHADLLSDIVAHADIVLAAATRPRTTTMSHARIDREEWWRARAAELGLAELCALYAAAGEVDEPGQVDARRVDDERRALARFEVAVRAFLRVPAGALDHPGDDGIDRLVTALAPRLRLVAPIEYAWLGETAATALVGRLLTVLAIYARLVHAVNASAVTLSTIHGLFAQLGHVMYLLAHIDRIPAIEALPEDRWTFRLTAGGREQGQRVLTFIYVENDDAGCTLGEIFDRLGIDDPVARLHVLQSLPIEAMKLITFRAPPAA